MPILKIIIANCSILAAETTKDETAGHVRNRTTFTLNGRTISYFTSPKVFRETSLKRGICADTGYLEANYSDADDRIQLQFTIENLCALLGFCTESKVLPYKTYIDGQLSGMRTMHGQIQTFLPPFDPADGESIKIFVNQVYNQYCQIKKSRNLAVVFDYLYYSFYSGLPQEIHLATLFILLENLKNTYAIEANYPFIDGYFRPLGSTTKKSDRLSFEYLIDEMLDFVNMGKFAATIKSFRNELIHTGLINRPPDEQWEIFAKCQDVIREYILRLLGYKGAYNLFSDRTAVSKIA